VLYRHCWICLPNSAEYRRQWPHLLDDIARIIGYARQAGVVIAGPAGRSRPVIDAEHGVAFNGDATSDLDGQPFTLLAPIDAPGMLTLSACCTTGRKPYDAAVAAVLLRCTQLMPGAIAVSSSGRWNQHWAHGAMLEHLDEPGYRLSARAMVADLFGPTPETSPLQSSLADLRFPLPAPGHARPSRR
jgi:hypothetical protein